LIALAAATPASQPPTLGRSARALAAALLVLAALPGPAGAQAAPGRAVGTAEPGPTDVPGWSLAARQRLSGLQGTGSDELLARRRQQLDDGERLLAAGETGAAQEAFNRAALMLHAPDTEAALVRTYMQAGEYRQALAFGAHAAGAHRREWPAGMALYAWLLQVGGQGVVARRMLDEALALAPDDPALRQARGQLASPWPSAEGLLRTRPLQVAPNALGQTVPQGAQAVGSALLVQDGHAALVPAALLGPAADGRARVWLRNGLGQTVAAQPDVHDPALGLVLLRLPSPLPGCGPSGGARAPFGGSPGYLVEYAPDPLGAPAWPLLRQGFFARLSAAPGPRPLGIEAPAGPRGGPVFDAFGQVAGIAVHLEGADRLVPAASLTERFGVALRPVAPSDSGAPTTPAARADVDAVYEQSLRCALQVLVVR